MSTWPALRRELRETGITDREFKALRLSMTEMFKHLKPNIYVEVPSVTAAGRAYLLRIPTDAEAKPTKIEVELDPDLSSPAFDAYTDFCAKHAAAAPTTQAGSEGEGQ